MSGFPDARSVVHLICKDRKELLSSCNRKSPLLYHLNDDELCFGTLLTLYHICYIQACSFTISRSVSSIKS